MAQTDDWGGVLVEEPEKDDWGGVATPETDDWGGIAVEDTAPPVTPTEPAKFGSSNAPWPTAQYVPGPSINKPSQENIEIVNAAMAEGVPVVMVDGKPTIGETPREGVLGTGAQIEQGILRGIGSSGMRAAEGIARLVGAKETADSIGRDLAAMDTVLPKQTTAGKVGTGVGNAMALMSGGGLPGMLGIAGTQAVAGGYDEAYAKSLEEGKSEEAARSDAQKGAFKSTLMAVPELAAYWLLGAGAAKAVAPLFPQAGPFLKSLISGTAATGADVATSAAINALHGDPLFSPEGLAMDATFGFLAHGLKVGKDAVHSEAQVRKLLKDAPLESLEAASLDPAFRKSSPYNPKFIDEEIAARKQSQPVADAVAGKTAPTGAAEPAATPASTRPATPEAPLPRPTEKASPNALPEATAVAEPASIARESSPTPGATAIHGKDFLGYDTVDVVFRNEQGEGRGQLYAKLEKDKKQLRIYNAESAKPGQGVGTAMYREMIKEAGRLGFDVVSDRSVSDPAIRVYEKLKAEGYDVIQNPNTQRFAKSLITGTDEPVFRIKPPKQSAEPLPEPQPPPKDTSAPSGGSASPEPVGSGAKLGPGAANIEEPLAHYETRKFSDRFQADETMDPTLREQTGNRYYEPIPNKLTVAEAETIINTRGIDESARVVRDETFPMEPRVRATMAQGLIKKLNQSYTEAVKAGDPKAQKFLDQAVDTAEYLGEMGTRLGQGVQAFAIWSRLTPEGMLMQAKRIVTKAKTEFEATNGESVKEIVDAVNAAPAGDRMKVLIKISETNPVAKKVKSDFEAIIAASKDGKLTKDQFYDKVSKKLGIPTLTPENVAKITKLTAEIEKAPEGFQRDDKTRELLSFLSELKGADLSEIPTSLYYANILSGYTTQLVNTLDTAINVFSDAAAHAVANPKSAPAIFTGLYQGFLKGIPEAANVLKTGKGRAETKLQVPSILERSKFGTEGGVPINESTAIGRVLKAALESKPANILNLWKYPLRAMVASDTVLYNSAKEARARVLARALGKSEGLKGDDLFRRVDEILHNTQAERVDAARQAADEGLSGNAAKRRVAEILEQKRPEDLVSNADEAAGLATYNHDPQGTLGLVSSRVGEIASKVPGGVFVVPFTRIIANVTNRGLDYSPYGFKRLFFGRGGGKGFESPAVVGEEFKVQLVKATAGTIGMTTLAMLDASGVVDVTANGPSDPNERKQLQAAGWKPFSVKIGGRYYSYQNIPIGLGLGMVGHYRDAVRYNKLDEKDAQARLIYSVTGAANTITSMSFLSGLSDFMEMINGRGSSTDGAKRFFQRTVSGIAVPNIVKQINRIFDPKLYQSDTITQAILRDTPAARIVSKPMLNVLGDPIQMSSNRFTSEATDDPVWKLIVEKQAWVPTPSKTTKIRNRPITPEEYYTLIEKSGPLIKDYIKSNLSSLQSMTAEKAQEAVQNRASEIRAGVKSRF